MMHGQVPVLHWFNEAGLAKKYFTSDQFSIDFQAICAHDAYSPRKQNIQLAVVTFIHDNYCYMFNNFLNEGNHQHLLSMFSCAASDGLLDIVTWLTDTFIKKMTTEEKTAVINYEGKLALMRAAENNHVHILEFLNRKFNCISELNNDPAYAFSTAALHGHLDSMKWLHTNFPMNNDHMCAFYESWNQTPIESLQKAGHVIGVQWMIDQNLAAGSRFNDHGFIDYRNDKKGDIIKYL